MERQENKRERQARLMCVTTEEYILWKEREGRMARGEAYEIAEDEQSAW